MQRKFLITRDEIAATKILFDLTNLGYLAEIFPLSKIESLNFDIKINPKKIIITSKNALKSKPNKFWLELSKQSKFLLVGISLANEISKMGITNFVYFDQVLSLLKYLENIRDSADQNLIYLRGNYVSYDLKQVISLTEIICYSVEYLEFDSEKLSDFILENHISDLLFFSRFNAEHFLKILNPHLNQNLLKNLNIFCLSHRIAQAFKACGKVSRDRIFYPEKPSFAELSKLF